MKRNVISLRRDYIQETGFSNRINKGKGEYFDTKYVEWLEDIIIKTEIKSLPRTALTKNDFLMSLNRKRR